MRFLTAALVYVVVTMLLFGDPLKPLMLATLWSDRLGTPYWQAIASLAILASTLVFFDPGGRIIADVYKLPIFVFLAVVLPTVTVGLYSDWIRHRAIHALHPDDVDAQSFFTSIRLGPTDYEFYTHTALLKSCTAYFWSYRNQNFSALDPNTGVNVLPRAWIDRCKIKKDSGH